MFGGVTELNLDLKNRLCFPSRYRQDLVENSGRLVVTLESSQCLLVYPESYWSVVREKIQNLPTGSHPLVRSYQRLVLGYAETLVLDKSGRILISQSLREMTGLTKEVVLVGIGNRFELWDKPKWQEETTNALKISAKELAMLLEGFSL